MAVDWSSIGRILRVGPLAYALLVVFLRLTGNRTPSKLNSFDLVVTVALGSLLASAVLDRRVGLAEGATAFGLLVALQYVVTWLSVRVPAVDRLVKAKPTAL